jgi:hypothetical protein
MAAGAKDLDDQENHVVAMATDRIHKVLASLNNEDDTRSKSYRRLRVQLVTYKDNDGNDRLLPVILGVETDPLSGEYTALAITNL